MDDEDSG